MEKSIILRTIDLKTRRVTGMIGWVFHTAQASKDDRKTSRLSLLRAGLIFFDF